MATRRLLYAATPIEGKALVRANYEVDVANRGIVPYFVRFVIFQQSGTLNGRSSPFD